MATFDTTFLFVVTPDGADQFAVIGRVAGDTNASTNADDDTLSVGDVAPVTFDDPTENSSFGGDYTYVGHVPGISGYIGESNGNFFLFSNESVPVGGDIPFVPEDITVCFMAGTMISTPDGERPVETLAIGDLLLTADGRSVPVQWLGRQTIVTMFGPPERHRPVCIAAGALGDNLPVRDLRVTSGHALLIDGVLVHAGALVNGTSIRRLTAAELGERFIVYHIETENHELVLAQGAPAETYIDNVPRQCFDNYAEYAALFAQDRMLQELAYPRALSARQVPHAIRARIAAAAAVLVPARDKVA